MKTSLLELIKALKENLTQYYKELNLFNIEAKNVDDIDIKQSKLEKLYREYNECPRCRLSKSRSSIVFGEGSVNAKLMFIGEAPGRDEDLQGKPFIGKAGQLLTKIISSISLSRDDVYITNVVKCRPPGNRDPKEDEISTCSDILASQIDIIRPKIICSLGNFASRTLLNTETPISRLRGRFYLYQGIKLMPTYHPAFLLRNPEMKRDVWHDVQKIQELYSEL